MGEGEGERRPGEVLSGRCVAGGYLNAPLRAIRGPSRVTPRCLCFVVSRLVRAETRHEGMKGGGEPVDKLPQRQTSQRVSA